jgi:hypothetical protein
MNKYGNKKITVDGETFDSRREYARYKELQLLERAGEISALRRQVPFVLIPAQYEEYERYGKNGQRLTNGRRCVERECSYLADFVYRDNTTGRKVVEDSKGMRTKDYIIKRKLMLHIHKIKIKEV